jgi:peptidoglycan/xylan/chitin deacetylase (PgdA/CDA1 family)
MAGAPDVRARRLVGIAGAVALIALGLPGCGAGMSRVTSTHAPAPAAPLLAPPTFVRHGTGRSESATMRRLLRLGLPIYCAAHQGREIALTFDDGPGVYTGLAIRKLTRWREGATFFDVGRSMDRFPGYVRRELRVAAIGDHTYTHPVLIDLSPSEITWQLEATARKIEAQSGQHVDLFRPPYELHNATVDRIAHRLGLLEILWDVDSQDSLGANYAEIIEHVEAGLHAGAIIELHENRGQTIRALTTLLPVLHRRHWRSVSVPELLASDPPSPAQVRRGTRGCGRAAAGHAKRSSSSARRRYR